MRVLVTGGNGVFGSVLVPHLRGAGHTVLNTDLAPAIPSDDYKFMDVTRAEDVMHTVADFAPDVVVNLAGSVGRVHASAVARSSFDANVTAPFVLSEALRLFRLPPRLIHFSTSEVYGDADETESGYPQPKNWYGQSKLLGEQVVIARVKDYVIVRPFMMYHENEPYGDHRSAMVRFAGNIATEKVSTVHVGSARSWLHMDDAARFVERLMFAASPPRILNIGNVEAPMPMVVLVQRLGSLIGKTPLYHMDGVDDPSIRLLKTPDLRRMIDLGLLPCVSMEDGIARVAARWS